ncbi:MAG: hypothetical protein LKI27_09145 [Actinomyces sp.]|jgi:hypothetical protein|nr:hypothetical protein [Actinomyces sp.]MCI1642821.1 hypothetical protein [Actinomyces sp.]MCI1663041.1 hypothetical protein [Actinomyces sp.]
MSQDDERDRIYDPMIYDIMREIANQVIGRYLVWQRAATGREAQHWQDERIRTRLAVEAVNADSRRAVEAKTAELRETLRHMPEHAPAFA